MQSEGLTAATAPGEENIFTETVDYTLGISSCCEVHEDKLRHNNIVYNYCPNWDNDDNVIVCSLSCCSSFSYQIFQNANKKYVIQYEGRNGPERQVIDDRNENYSYQQIHPKVNSCNCKMCCCLLCYPSWGPNIKHYGIHLYKNTFITENKIPLIHK